MLAVRREVKRRAQVRERLTQFAPMRGNSAAIVLSAAGLSTLAVAGASSATAATACSVNYSLQSDGRAGGPPRVTPRRDDLPAGRAWSGQPDPLPTRLLDPADGPPRAGRHAPGRPAVYG